MKISDGEGLTVVPRSTGLQDVTAPLGARSLETEPSHRLDDFIRCRTGTAPGRPDPRLWRPVSREELYAGICTRDPYFALEDVHADAGGAVVAVVPAQQPLGHEVGPMSGAEVGRHLAILGSCAAAQVNPRPGRHYYLASSAVLKRLGGAAAWGERGPLFGWGRAEFTSRRSCVARTALHAADGSPVYELQVGYHVLPAAVFDRMFADARLDMRRSPRDGAREPAGGEAQRRNPFTRELPLGPVEVTGDRGRAYVERIDPEICKGHFAFCPVLPVAIVMYGLSSVGGAVLAVKHGGRRLRYVITHGVVEAKNFARAGDGIVFESELARAGDGEYGFACRAVTTAGVAVGEMDFSATVV